MAMSTKKRGRPKRFNDDDQQYLIQSVDRALQVLNLLSKEDRLSVSDISDELEMSHTTAYRMLQNLEAHSLAMFDEHTQTWSVGSQSVVLSSSFLRNNSFIQTSQKCLVELMEKTNETVSMAIVKKNCDVTLICQIAAKQTTRANFFVGYQLPVHASGIGKAALANLEPAEIKAVLRNQDLTKFTDNTIDDKEALSEELSKIHLRGYAIDDEEVTIGMRCLAVPVFDGAGKLSAGISVSGPTHRLSEERYDEIGAELQQVAKKLSEDIEAREYAGIGL